ncbi:MAG: diacylglycerol kinase family protein [Cyclobacteriaceae bacterium]
MDIHLIYNETAGDGDHSIPRILKSLKNHSANVVVFNKKSSKLKHFLKKKCDFLLIAGGDGTVGKVLKKMVEDPVPIAVLPLGNANNIAESLNIDDFLDGMVRNWKGNKMQSLSMGFLEKEGKVDYFLESIGWGLFANTLAGIKKEKKQKSKDPEDKVAFGLEKLEDALKDLKPISYEIKIDGKDYSGDYLWIEVMNTNYMGPNLHVAPEADAEDRYLDVILIKKGEEEKIKHFIKHQQQKNSHKFDLAIKAKEVLIKEKGAMHIDDKIMEDESGSEPPENWLRVGLHPQKFKMVPSK